MKYYAVTIKQGPNNVPNPYCHWITSVEYVAAN